MRTTELMQLRYFQVAAYYEHMSKAAEYLNVSQPALSSMISRLEKELGLLLFDHIGRTVRLNNNGKILLKHVNHVFMEIEDAKSELKDSTNKASHLISFAASSPQFLQGMQTFMAKFPDCKWNQRLTNNEEIKKLLKRGQIDLAVVSPGIYDEEFESTLLTHDVFKLAVHKDNPLSKKKIISLRELTNEPFIMLTKDQPFRRQTDAIFSEFGITPNFIMECDHLLRRELINSNAGITIASQSALFRHLYSDDIRFIDIEGVHQTRDIVLVINKNRYKSKVVKQFEAFLKNKFLKKS